VLAWKNSFKVFWLAFFSADEAWRGLLFADIDNYGIYGFFVGRLWRGVLRVSRAGTGGFGGGREFARGDIGELGDGKLGSLGTHFKKKRFYCLVTRQNMLKYSNVN